jgi:acyl dehydratase
MDQQMSSEQSSKLHRVAGTPVFEALSAGQVIDPLKLGPFTTAHLMRWSAAMENWHKIHYDLPFATGHDKLPGLLINGSLKQQFIAQMLKDWAGPAGWVWKIRFQFRAMNLVGERLEVWATVKDTRKAHGPAGAMGLVDLDLGMRNEAGVESTPGSATVALPLQGGPALPYPFVPPTE